VVGVTTLVASTTDGVVTTDSELLTMDDNDVDEVVVGLLAVVFVVVGTTFVVSFPAGDERTWWLAIMASRSPVLLSTKTMARRTQMPTHMGMRS
jgi:hypothetical protein